MLQSFLRSHYGHSRQVCYNCYQYISPSLRPYQRSVGIITLLHVGMTALFISILLALKMCIHEPYHNGSVFSAATMILNFKMFRYCGLQASDPHVKKVNGFTHQALFYGESVLD